MSYTANQYNYATPLSSVSGLTGEKSTVADNKYFALHDNILDGSYHPIAGDVGLWSAAAADSSGALPEPFVVTVTEDLTVNAFRLVGSQYSYPVAFTVAFYNGSTLLHTVTETSNNRVEYVAYLPRTLTITKYAITVTKVSKAGGVVRLYNAYNPAYVKRVDTLNIKHTESSDILNGIYLVRTDTLQVVCPSTTVAHVTMKSVDTVNVEETEVTTIHNTIDVTTDTLSMKQLNGSAIRNTIDVTKDTLLHKVGEDVSDITNIIDVTSDTLEVKHEEVPTLTNVHTRMKEPYREIYGKVYITYTDPMLDHETTVLSASEAYNSNKEQLLDGIDRPDYRYFALYDNNLSGEYTVNGVDSQTGWVSKEISNDDGTFTNPPSVSISFSERPIVSLAITFDNSRDNLVKDFSVTFTTARGDEVLTFTDNDQLVVPIFTEPVTDVTSITVTVSRISRGNAPAVIVDMPISSTILYRGYKDVSEIMSIDLLEELTYEDDVEALGGVSANEITVTLDNSSKSFFGENSVVYKQLKRNRKIVPWLGVEVIPGEIEWYTLGTFWSYNWDTPVNGLTATVVGFDTIGLLDHTPFDKHHVQVNKSIGYLIEYVLEDAKQSLNFIEYDIDESLYDTVVPYAWFDNSSHGMALRKISKCFPMHVYCDRLGKIHALPQRLNLDYFYDEWSDSTNVIDKSYSSLHTTVPNIINVTVIAPSVLDNEELVNDTVAFTVQGNYTKTLNFNRPYVSNLSLDVDCDSTLTYSYTVYSWGVLIDFVGRGSVRSITCTGSCVDASNSSLVNRRNDASIRLNGAITRTIESDFIQTVELAQMIIDRIVALSENDRYDATVNYRGDISLTINDPIILHQGIAPDNRYTIKRHQLSWNGGLTGSAELNT